MQMGWTYRAEFIPQSSGLCLRPLYFVEHQFSSQGSDYQLVPPRTPRIRCVPLPPNAPPVAAAPTIFPFQIAADISHIASTLSRIRIPTSTTIHVHDPIAHIGHIDANPGARTAYEIIEFIQRTAHGPLHPATYQSLSLQTKIAVERAYIHRATQIMGQHGARQLWSLFIRGHYHPNGPCGADLLLGNTDIWSVDAVPGSGVCCLQVA